MNANSYHYYLYGLNLQSNLPIEQLHPVSAQAADLRLTFGAAPPGLEPGSDCWQESPEYVNQRTRDQGENPMLRIYTSMDGRNCLRLHYTQDAVDFIIQRSGDQVWVLWPNEFAQEHTIPYLIGPVMGFVLRLRSVLCLHASAIAVGDRCFAITGHIGAGKSTLAAAFASNGYPVVTDDIAPLTYHENQFYVSPGYPRLRLWRNSIEALNEDPEDHPRIMPDIDKHYVDVEQRFYDESLPLAAIYVLHERRYAILEPEVLPVPPKEAMLSLMPHTYMNYLLNKSIQVREFGAMAHLVKHVPLRQVKSPADLQKLPEIMARILDDLRSLEL